MSARRAVVLTDALATDEVRIERAINGQPVVLIGRGSCGDMLAAMGVCPHDQEPPAVSGAPAAAESPALNDDIWFKRGMQRPERQP